MIHGLDLSAVRLKKVETRVRRRDGSVFVERREGCRFVAEETGEVEVPDYVKEQESGISRLVPRAFDASSGRWVPFSDNGDAAEISSTNLRVVSYNVWFDKQNQHARATALFGILAKEDADLIFLQVGRACLLAHLPCCHLN
jgi:hypothetical protein